MQEITVAIFLGLAIKLYALLTPTVILSAFINYTHKIDRPARRKIALKTGVAIYVTGQILIVSGSALFDIFGFTLDAFRIGVGLLLFLSAVELMDHDESGKLPANPSLDISVVPLAIPLGMGPSTIGAVMVLGATAKSTTEIIFTSSALLLAAFGITVTLYLARAFERVLGKTGLLVLSKLTALLVSAIAAQVIFTGIRAFLKQ
ncbi:MAG: MarC family protein [Desulfovibrio sp.]|nr:MarC family protein [Desulfovibrio sp.]